MTIVLLANGFEEIEALTPVDMLRRAGIEVATVGVSGKTVSGAHGINVVCDLLPEEVELSNIDMLILPGGMPGTLNLDASHFTSIATNAVISNGGRIGAICAAPLILGRRGLLNGVEATCYPGFEDELTGAIISDVGVITDGYITTARGMGVATEFAAELIALTLGSDKANEILSAICTDKRIELPESNGTTNLRIDTEPFFEIIKSNTEYNPPSLELLAVEEIHETSSSEIEQAAETISSVFKENGLSFKITEATQGPRITRFALKINSNAQDFLELRDDLMLALRVESVRILTPAPQKPYIEIEIPNKSRSVVRLRSILSCDKFVNSKSITTVCLGKDTIGNPVVEDLSKMPHIIVAGATGMGKSVVLNSMLASLLFKAHPDELKLIMIDPKMVEFDFCEGLPHLLMPVITNPRQTIAAFDEAIKEMERRYELFGKNGVRNIDDYNKKIDSGEIDGDSLPYVVIFVDELADLMLQVGREIEGRIVRLAQKSRAAGIHMILGTQRPTNDVITSIIKANIPSRLCFKVTSAEDSINVLDGGGAERLLDRGDALYYHPSRNARTRVQCAYASAEEMWNIVKSLSTK